MARRGPVNQTYNDLFSQPGNQGNQGNQGMQGNQSNMGIQGSIGNQGNMGTQANPGDDMYADQQASIPALQYHNPHNPALNYGPYAPTMYSGANQNSLHAMAMSYSGNQYSNQMSNQYEDDADGDDEFDDASNTADADYKYSVPEINRAYLGAQSYTLPSPVVHQPRPKVQGPYFKGRMKYRKNTKPLEPIDIRTAHTPEDRKRMQNTLAARKTRARREARQIAMEAKNTELKHEVQFYKHFILSCGFEIPTEVGHAAVE